MGSETGIQWTDSTWNPIRGCTRVSPGCGGPGPHGGCYAEIMAARFSQPGQWGHGFAEMKGGDHRWTGRVELIPSMLDLPLRWKKPRRIFVNSTSDLFHEALPDEAIDQVFAVMAMCPRHTFQVLTKRPERMRDYLKNAELRIAKELLELGAAGFHFKEITPRGVIGEGLVGLQPWPLPNVWLGTSVEDQERADERIPLLLETPAAVRFISAEPLLGPIDLSEAWHGEDALSSECWGECGWCKNGLPPLHNCERGAPSLYEGRDQSGLDWVIAGGESGPGARPMHPDWARGLRDQCTAAGVPYFFKQWGSHTAIYDRDRDDPDWRQCDIIKRDNPDGRWLNLAGGHGFHGDRVVYAVPSGKKAAGRLLDGVEHNEFPRAAA